MENMTSSTTQNMGPATMGGLQALLITRFAPRAISAAATLFRRHPVLLVGSVLIGLWAWKRQRASSNEALTSPADLIH